MSKRTRAQVCVEKTNEAIRKKIAVLLRSTIESHLHDFIKEQVLFEEEIVAKALSTLPKITEFLIPLRTITTISLAHKDNNNTNEYITMKHVPLHKELNFIVNTSTGLFRNQLGVWIEVEEIASVARMYSTVQKDFALDTWQRQFLDDGSWTEAGLSRMCALSPNYRACLVNIGESSWSRIEPAKISLYKHGPRSRTFEPMPPQLAKALQVAANMQEPA